MTCPFSLQVSFSRAPHFGHGRFNGIGFITLVSHRPELLVCGNSKLHHRMPSLTRSRTRELKSYGIVSDSEPNKDFLLVNVAYRKHGNDPYVKLDADGVLLNFSHAEYISFIKQTAP